MEPEAEIPLLYNEHDKSDIAFEDIDDIYQLLQEEGLSTNPDTLSQDVSLYLECNDDIDGLCGISLDTPNSDSNMLPTVESPVNRPQAVNIPAGNRHIYRLSFPEASTETKACESTPNVTFSCCKCSKLVKRKTLLLDHLSKIHDMKDLYLCALCPYKGQLYSQWYKHMKRKHTDDPVNIDHVIIPSVTMDICNESSACSEHPEQNHDSGCQPQTGIASTCVKNLSNGENKTDDISGVEVTHTTKRPDVPIISCPVCCKQFKHRRSLQHHKRIHKQDRQHACSVTGCTKMFKTYGALNEHQNNVHGSKLYKCNHSGCSKAYATKRYLNYHQRTHLDSFKCDVCAKTFRDGYNLQMHMRSHTGDKQMKCKHCDYLCVQKSSMNWHMKSKHKGL